MNNLYIMDFSNTNLYLFLSRYIRKIILVYHLTLNFVYGTFCDPEVFNIYVVARQIISFLYDFIFYELLRKFTNLIFSYISFTIDYKPSWTVLLYIVWSKIYFPQIHSCPNTNN
jgi:hypothetical protein